MRRLVFGLIVALAAIATSGAASAAACADPRQAAPGRFDNPPSWGSDDGVVVDGFLDLAGASGPMEVSHGVDLSRYQAHTNYAELKRCGAQFAIVKYSADGAAVFARHVAQLAMVGIPAWPYFYLGMDRAYRYDRETFENADPSAADFAAMEAGGRSDARAMIPLFKSATRGTLSGSFGGIAANVVFIDVEDKLDVSGKDALQWRARHGISPYTPLPRAGDERDREQTTRIRYSKLYAARVSGWIREFRSTFPDVIVVLYTSPSVYTDYLINGRFDDLTAYHGLPVWLANYRPDGGEVNWTSCVWSTKEGCKGVCLSADGGNRCIVHQYTSRGIFAVNAPPGPGRREHIDLSRLFQVEVKQDGVGVQYVDVRRRRPPLSHLA